MDRNIGVGLEAQSHVPLLDPDHRDFDHALKAYRSSNHNRFVVFSRQDQHGIASIRVTDAPHPESAMRSTYRIEWNTKKADVVAHPWVFDHVGLLTDEPPGTPGLPFL
jgi:hypothetical protein